MMKDWIIVKAIKNTVVDYCENSSIHGIPHLVRRGRSLWERLFWCLFLSLTIVVGFYVAVSNYIDIAKHYTRDHIKSLHYPTYLVPKPAFTLCNSNQLQRSRAKHLVDSLYLPLNLNKTWFLENISLLSVLIPSQIVYIPAEKVDIKKLKLLQRVLDANNVSIEQAIYRMSQPCSEMFVSCRIGGVIVSCSDLIETTKTDLGFCCSAHFYSSNDTTGIIVYPKKTKNNRVVYNYGFESGNGFLLNLSMDDSLLMNHHVPGIEVYVQTHIYQHPHFFSLRTYASYTWETFIRLHVVMQRASPALKSLSPTYRLCYFLNEVKLKYFDVYNFGNCLCEAEMDYVVDKCGCLPLTYPSTGVYRTCNLMDYECLLTFHFNINYFLKGASVIINGVKYKCYHTCNEPSYKVHSSSGDFQATYANAFKYYDKINTSKLTAVHIFMDSPSVTLYYKEPFNNIWDTIASFGGVLGIFLGVHFFCFVEIFYFFVIRCIFHLKILRRANLPEN